MSGFNVLQHHGSKLFVRDFTVTVLIDLLDDLIDNLLIQVLSEGKNLLNFICRDGTTTILIEHFEGSVKLVVAQDILFVHCGHNKF